MSIKNQKSSDKEAAFLREGRLLPQAIEVEEAVLGALMLDKDAYQVISGILSAEMFYDEANNAVFRAIQALSDARRPIDLLTVFEALKRSGELEAAGGAHRLSQLTANIAGSSHIEYHARIIEQKYLARRLITITHEVQQRAFDETEDVEDIMQLLETKLTEISTSRASAESVKLDKAVPDAIKKASEVQELRTKGVSLSIPTGIGTLTKALNGGWKAPELIILAARPSMGKSQMALHFAKSAAEAGKEVLFVSIEMSSTQLVTRLFLEDSRINAYNLMTGQMSNEEWEALDRRASEIWDLKIHISDSPEIRYLDAICSEARRLKRKGELGMVIIDYLGLILVRGQKFERRQLEIARITGTLKSLAKELDVPVMLLSQLNRPERGVAVKEPQLHDLRESGDIEQDADIVLFIHRPSYYDEGSREWEGRGKIIIAKHREGVRNRAVEFFHDSNFKKIWGNGEEPYMTQTNTIHPDRNVEPQEDSNPF
jgi:replicative DNA helicase